MTIKKEVFFYYPRLQRGGILTTLKIYSNYLVNNHKIKIFTNCNDKSILAELNKSIHIINIGKKYYFLKKFLSNIYIIFLISKYANKETIIFSLQDHFLILLLNKFFLKNKIIIRTSSIIPNKRNIVETNQYKYIFVKKIIIQFYKLASHIITFSKNNVSYFKSLGIYNSSCIYNFFQKEKPRVFIKKKKFNFFFIGRFSSEKDPVFFLKNLLKIPNINIHMVGSGLLEKNLKNISKNKENVFFHKYTNNPIHFFKNKIDLLCITSVYEGTPNIMGEAMACSIPVLAPKEVGLTKLFLKNAKYGYLYKLKSSKSFTRQVYSVINNYSLAIKKAKKGRLSLDRFNSNNTLRKVQEIITKI